MPEHLEATKENGGLDPNERIKRTAKGLVFGVFSVNAAEIPIQAANPMLAKAFVV
jgi:hypothetical protein